MIKDKQTKLKEMQKTKQKVDIFPNKIRNESDVNMINEMQIFNKANDQY